MTDRHVILCDGVTRRSTDVVSISPIFMYEKKLSLATGESFMDLALEVHTVIKARAEILLEGSEDTEILENSEVLFLERKEAVPLLVRNDSGGPEINGYGLDGLLPLADEDFILKFAKRMTKAGKTYAQIENLRQRLGSSSSLAENAPVSNEDTSILSVSENSDDLAESLNAAQSDLDDTLKRLGKSFKLLGQKLAVSSYASLLNCQGTALSEDEETEDEADAVPFTLPSDVTVSQLNELVASYVADSVVIGSF